MSENLTLGIAAVSTAAVILRPFNWPEAIWAVAGAALLLALGLLSPHLALAGVARGTDVYLFLIGMMLLAEIARYEGLFDWLAVQAMRHAEGSPLRLFALVYGVGVVVTVFLSNDATAVVMTPAVAAAMRTARIDKPLPYLLVCALVANAASFVLPISNPANLVVQGTAMPPLLQWLAIFTLPSLAAIAATYAALRLTFRSHFAGAIASDIAEAPLSRGAITAALGIGATAIGLMIASALGRDLGLPTAIAGIATTLVVAIIGKEGAPTMLRHVMRDISWGVLPLVAGLFVLVQALEGTGVLTALVDHLQALARQSVPAASWITGLVTAFTCNVTNNLPAGLIAGSTVQAAQVPDAIRAAAVIGIDIGPNLSITGSLATILWLTALRREGHGVSAWAFLKIGFIAMPPALLLALGALSLQAWFW
ncbi:arsenic transporter [Labrys miyagiensis]|uniref:Arsenic transporter n=1 Tax=Labrys miyagiensis TaxID=346912 RepID=A0ABQ6CFR0_9HYPH|nr:arsenic transporter [Labrys miyagiensis]GLS17067.1 arsenic transporter [Labrys miyagiensis]